jgi:hypothetical protein
MAVFCCQCGDGPHTVVVACPACYHHLCSGCRPATDYNQFSHGGDRQRPKQPPVYWWSCGYCRYDNSYAVDASCVSCQHWRCGCCTLYEVKGHSIRKEKKISSPDASGCPAQEADDALVDLRGTTDQANIRSQRRVVCLSTLLNRNIELKKTPGSDQVHVFCGTSTARSRAGQIPCAVEGLRKGSFRTRRHAQGSDTRQRPVHSPRHLTWRRDCP